MKVKELLKILKNTRPDDDVVISIDQNKSYMCSKPFVKINDVYMGFDWDYGKIHLISFQNITRVKNKLSKKELL